MVVWYRSFFIQSMADVINAEVKALSPSKTYLVCLGLSRKLSAKETQEEINRTELMFKVLGIKNVKVIPNGLQILEVEK